MEITKKEKYLVSLILFVQQPSRLSQIGLAGKVSAETKKCYSVLKLEDTIHIRKDKNDILTTSPWDLFESGK